MATLKADRRLYVNADRSALAEGKDRAYLLYPEGADISPDDAEKYGLGPGRAKAADRTPPSRGRRQAAPADGSEDDTGEAQDEAEPEAAEKARRGASDKQLDKGEDK